MPTVLTRDGYRWFFYSREGHEPPHVHVEHGDRAAKLWLSPVAIASNYGFRSIELKRLRLTAIEYRLRFLENWHEHFGIAS